MFNYVVYQIINEIKALSHLSAQCCQRLVFLELNHMSVVTKSLVKELTDVGLKSIRDVQLIGTPIESEAVKLLCSKCCSCLQL